VLQDKSYQDAFSVLVCGVIFRGGLALDLYSLFFLYGDFEMSFL